ncbi:GNAT family acetyltransferase [Apiospora marii]|uniref:GNAT family acetyltransferase n=1 Tax=Apiospora marii TaxID=335849 RepID=A0ABR1S9D5_9PEZI
MVSAGFKIVHVRASDPAQVATVARLFTAYTNSLGIDLAYQNYAAELACLPGKYGPPDGALLLLVRSRDTKGAEEGDEDEAEAEAAALGCVALRALPDVEVDGATSRRRNRRAEIKRLYVDPAARGHRLGRALFAAVLDEARGMGYDEVVLDTLAHMSEARRMYEREGFVRLAEPYYEVAGGPGEGEDKGEQQQHPEGTVFYRLEL